MCHRELWFERSDLGHQITSALIIAPLVIYFPLPPQDKVNPPTQAAFTPRSNRGKILYFRKNPSIIVDHIAGCVVALYFQHRNDSNCSYR